MKIGIFGGTFDPPHIGHVHACKSFYDSFKMDKLVVIPTAIPPHKIQKSDVDAATRLEMARIAFENLGEKVEVSDIELKRVGKSYTRDTIKYFLENGVDEILLLCGTDMLLTFDTWRDFEFIFNNATIVCIRRENDENLKSELSKKAIEFKEKYNARIEFLDVCALEVSSSYIRENINCENVEKLLPHNIYEFIKKRGLYI